MSHEPVEPHTELFRGLSRTIMNFIFESIYVLSTGEIECYANNADIKTVKFFRQLNKLWLAQLRIQPELSTSRECDFLPLSFSVQEQSCDARSLNFSNYVCHLSQGAVV